MTSHRSDWFKNGFFTRLFKNEFCIFEPIKTQPQDAPPQKLTLRAVRAAGRGTFGSVLQAVIEENKETVAVKTVYQDPQYQNRELEIMRKLRHDCIVLLKYYYLSERRNGTYLHLMMEFLPFSLGRVLKYYSRRGEQMPLIYQQVYNYGPSSHIVIWTPPIVKYE